MTNTPVRHTAARVGATTQPTSLTRRALYAAGTVIMTAALMACGGGSESAITPSAAPVTSAPPVVATMPPASGVGTMPPASGGGTAPVACEKTHANVGKVANLSTRSHGVSGKVVVVDNCTLEIRNFNYDGGGLSKVFVYGGKGGNYAAGFPVGNNLRGTSFANQTLTINLNAGDLDKMDGVSIWCADANANFGDGLFAPV